MANGSNSGGAWGWFWLIVVIVLIGGAFLYQHEGGKIFSHDDAVAHPPEPPRPEDAGFIDWLIGKDITVEKGMVFDSWWHVEPGEISDFKVIGISESLPDRTYTATVSFRATARGRGIQVREGLIRYKNADTPGKLKFVEFVPVSVSRIGN
jgi:hypothetical protein